MEMMEKGLIRGPGGPELKTWWREKRNLPTEWVGYLGMLRKTGGRDLNPLVSKLSTFPPVSLSSVSLSLSDKMLEERDIGESDEEDPEDDDEHGGNNGGGESQENEIVERGVMEMDYEAEKEEEEKLYLSDDDIEDS